MGKVNTFTLDTNVLSYTLFQYSYIHHESRVYLLETHQKLQMHNHSILEMFCLKGIQLLRTDFDQGRSGVVISLISLILQVCVYMRVRLSDFHLI